MRNLTSVTLSNNYFYGTLPAWLGELKQLEVINMAAFAGYDETTGEHKRTCTFMSAAASRQGFLLVGQQM